MAISDRVKECIDKLEKNDPVNAFIQLCIAIDGTAKKEYPGKKTSERCKEFLRNNLPFIMWSLTNGTPNECKSFEFGFSENEKPSGYTKFEDVIYSVLRCSLLHEGEMPSKVQFTFDNYIAMIDGKMMFPVALIGSLLFAVIASPVNQKEHIPNHYSFLFGNKRITVNDLWGNMNAMKDAIRNGFLYDVEEILKMYTQNKEISIKKI